MGMHIKIMSDRLASDLGNLWIKGSSARDCKHCGYNIPNGQTVFVESWLPMENLKEGTTKQNQIGSPQWSVYHPLCVAQKALFTVQQQLPNHQTPENDPTLEVEING